MSMDEDYLPAELIARASLAGTEYAWPVEMIPDVVEAARSASLINIGGQLQFRIPDVGTCECYWVEIDTYKSVPDDLSWSERVERTAEAAKSQYQQLRETFDFEAEGRTAFGEYLAVFEAKGGSVHDTMCFVWYVKSKPT